MRRALRLVLLLVVVGIAVVAYRRLGLGAYVTRDGMKDLVDRVGPTYAPLAFMAICVAGVFMHFPEIVLVACGGFALGAPKAFAFGWLACLIGATGTFVLVRYFAREHFQRVLARRFARLRSLDERLERHGFRTVLVLRLLLFMAPPLNWMLGATRVRLQHYVAATALGTIPGMATAVYFADSIATAPSGEGTDVRRIAVLLLLVGLFAIARVAGRRLFPGEQPVPPV